MQLQLFPYRYILIFVMVTVTACQSREYSDQPIPQQISGETQFDVKSEVMYAEGFRLVYHKNYKVLEILRPFQDHSDTLRYILRPRGVRLDQTFEDAQLIDIPVRSIIATSTTHVGLTNILDANKIIDGMVGGEYVYNREIRERLKSGKITSFSSGEFNKEQALALGPDLIMVSAGQSSQFDDYKVLLDSGINVLVNAEWLETTPLGKAEWVKMLGALLNEEKLANKKFNQVAEQYQNLKTRVGKVQNKPLVINNMPFKGAWFVSGGNSFEAALLKAAGADYPWFDNNSTGGLRKDFEMVYKEGLRADIWLNPGAVTTKKEILAKDKRFKDFKSFQTGYIYNNNRRISPSGGNDFWESGVVHPERLLADLIYIFHPEKLPGHSLFYYQRVEGDE